MFRIAIADGQSLHQNLAEHLLGQGGIELVNVEGIDTADSHEVLHDVDALMVTAQAVTAELLSGMPRCRIVSRLGTGVDAIDVSAATELGIWVANVPDYAVDEVSTHTMALLLAHARRLPRLFTLPEQGIWHAGPVGPIQRLRGQTLGLVGFGRIGQTVCAKAQGMGLRVVTHDAYLPPDPIVAAGAEPVDLETLLRRSDFVSLHVPLSAATTRIIDAQTLALMKPTAILINTARGQLVDEDALLAAIRSGQIAGAALDVLTVEPPPPDHPFFSEDRIWITPHVGWYSESAFRDVVEGACENVLLVLRGTQPRTPVNVPNPAARRGSR